MSRTRRFVQQPTGTKLSIAMVVDPPGSVQATYSLAVNGVGSGQPKPVPKDILEIPCPAAKTVYAVRLRLAWLAKGTVVTSVFTTHPDGTVVTREPVVMEGKAGAVDSISVNVGTK